MGQSWFLKWRFNSINIKQNDFIIYLLLPCWRVYFSFPFDFLFLHGYNNKLLNYPELVRTLFGVFSALLRVLRFNLSCWQNNLFLGERLRKMLISSSSESNFWRVQPVNTFLRRAELEFLILAILRLQQLSMLMKRKQNNIPQRERKWKKYSYLTNEEQKLFYDCQCGKRYVSFPAIFLHFQRKHKKKIMNTAQSRQFQVRKTNGEQVYYYFINQKRQPAPEKHAQGINDGKNSNLVNILQILQKFSQENRSQLQGFICEKYLQKTLENLIFFAYEKFKEEQKEDVEGKGLLQNLPLYFNDFMLSSGQEGKFQEKQLYQGCCLALYQFSKWLNQKQLSNLIISINFINQQ